MEPSTQQGVAMAGIGLAGAVAGQIFAWLRDRDKSQHDSRLISLEQKVSACEDKHAECEQAHADTASKLETAVSQLKARDERDRADMQAQIDVLRAQLAGKKDCTDGHETN